MTFHGARCATAPAANGLDELVCAGGVRIEWRYALPEIAGIRLRLGVTQFLDTVVALAFLVLFVVVGSAF